MKGTSRFFLAMFLVLTCFGTENGCHNKQEETNFRAESESKLKGRFFRSIWMDSTGGASSKDFLAIVIYFEDLSCVTCLNNLLDLSDSLQCDHKNVMLLVARTQDTYMLQRRRMEAWCWANHLRFPLFLVSPDSLRQNLVGRTSVALLDSSGEVELCESFPLSVVLSRYIIQRLRE